jgi:hypothetical protein
MTDPKLTRWRITSRPHIIRYSETDNVYDVPAIDIVAWSRSPYLARWRTVSTVHASVEVPAFDSLVEQSMVHVQAVAEPEGRFI